MPDSITPSTRPTYRHGNLRRKLLEHGIALAREGGPTAVVLREATRRAGVVPNAAYRHFKNRQDLLEAVRTAALAHLARAMELEINAVQHLCEPRQRARAAFRGVGLGYLRFARQEPGLFRTAFTARPFDIKSTGEDPLTGDSPRGASGMDPFQLLGHTLDGMVATGLLPADQRPGAEWMAWSAMHGMAFLVLDGPLRGTDESGCEALAERLVLMVEQGLLA